MANKTSFTPDEWKQILESVMLSGMAVTAAEPSGLLGVLKESMATGRSLIAAKSDPQSNDLVRAVVAEFETSEGRQAAREGLGDHGRVASVEGPDVARGVGLGARHGARTHLVQARPPSRPSRRPCSGRDAEVTAHAFCAGRRVHPRSPGASRATRRECPWLRGMSRTRGRTAYPSTVRAPPTHHEPTASPTQQHARSR